MPLVHVVSFSQPTLVAGGLTPSLMGSSAYFECSVGDLLYLEEL
jgi:hypothetical protein